MIRRIHATAMARKLGSNITELLTRRLGLLLLMRMPGRTWPGPMLRPVHLRTWPALTLMLTFSTFAFLSTFIRPVVSKITKLSIFVNVLVISIFVLLCFLVLVLIIILVF